MNRTRRVVTLCCSLSLFQCMEFAFGQQDMCPIGDSQCLDQRFGAACVNLRDGATADSCATWLAYLMQRPDAGEPEPQLLAGATYRALARFTDDPHLTQSHQEQAAAVFSRVLDRDPVNIRALYGLASTASTLEDRVAYLRMAVAANPIDLQTLNRLADTLAAVGGIASVRERIEIREQAYYADADLGFGLAYGDSIMQDQEARWRLTSSIVSNYSELLRHLESDADDGSELMDAETRRNRFIDQARDDLLVDATLEEVRRADTSDPEVLVTGLSLLCRSEALEIFGGRECMEALSLVADRALTSPDLEQGRRLTDVVGSTTESLLQQDSYLVRDNPDWRARVVESMEQLIASDVATPAVYANYATVQTDPEIGLSALRQGAVQFPTDSNVAIADAMMATSMASLPQTLLPMLMEAIRSHDPLENTANAAVAPIRKPIWTSA